MRVLIVCPDYKGIGGIKQHVRAQLSYLRREGHHVDIIANNDQIHLPVPKLRRITAMCVAYIRARCAGRYDVVHAHHPDAIFALAGASADRKILTLHGRYIQQREFISGPLLRWFSRRIERLALLLPDVLTVVDSDTQLHYSNITNLPIYKIPNGIDIASLPKDSYRRFEKQVIYAGRLSKEKGIRELLKVAETLPNDVHLIIIGSGVYKDSVQVIAERCPNVHYLGLCSREDAVRWIRGSDVLIEPSILANGFPSSVIEAMACRTAVVAHNIPAYREFMNNDVAVLFSNHSNIIRIVNELLANNAYRIGIIDRAYKRVKSYDFPAIGKQYLALYNNDHK